MSKGSTSKNSGANSTLMVGDTLITALGGGCGGRWADNNNSGDWNGLDGGSGGGAYHKGQTSPMGSGTVGATTQQTSFAIEGVVAEGFGNAGSAPTVSFNCGGGGGGAGEAGNELDGGEGIANGITGQDVVYGSGGGGGAFHQSSGEEYGVGGTNAGQGGYGLGYCKTSGTDGVTQTGGGGGGCCGGNPQSAGQSFRSGSGGSGVVVIRYAGGPVVKIPSLAKTAQEYTGDNLLQTVDVDPAYVSVSYSNNGNWTMPGVYTATCTLRANAQWNDGTTAPKVLSFTVIGTYVWTGNAYDGGKWSTPDNWDPPAGLTDSYPDSNYKTAKFTEGTWTVDVDVTKDIYDFVLESGKAVHVTLAGDGKISRKCASDITVSAEQSLHLCGLRLTGGRASITGRAYVDDCNSWPLTTVFVADDYSLLAMMNCHVVSTTWDSCWAWDNQIVPMYATNCTVMVTDNFRNAEFFHFNLKDSAFGFKFTKKIQATADGRCDAGEFDAGRH